MIAYLIKYPNKILIPLQEHIQLVLLTMLLSVLLASFLTILAIKFPRIGKILTEAFSLLYSVPSLALFALMIPFTGLGVVSAVIVLVAYNQYLLLRTFLTGLHQVDPVVMEAARGIGMRDFEILFRVQIPLAKAALFAGIRLAVISTIGIGTIASGINAGGLGDLLFDGLRTMNTTKILWGTVLSAGLAICLSACLKKVEKQYSS